MSYAKIDDLYDDKRKVKRAWRDHRAAVGLHAMAITYCVRHRTDGRIPDDWLEEMLPAKRERDQVLTTLVGVALFDADPHADGTYTVHDFLEWNESAAERKARSDAGRNAAGRRWSNANGNADGNAKPNAKPNAKGNAPV